MKILDKVEFPMYIGYRLEGNETLLYDKENKIANFGETEVNWQGNHKDLEERIREIENIEEL